MWEIRRAGSAIAILPQATGVLLSGVCGLLLGVLAMSAEAEGVYRWTDSSGKIQFSDRPPANREAAPVRIREQSFGGAGSVARGGTSQGCRIRMFVTQSCGYCRKARAYLNARGQTFQEIDVEQDAEGRAEFRRLGGKGVPVILVGEQRMDGYGEGRLEAMLKTAGCPG